MDDKTFTDEEDLLIKICEGSANMEEKTKFSDLMSIPSEELESITKILASCFKMGNEIAQEISDKSLDEKQIISSKLQKIEDDLQKIVEEINNIKILIN